ncbi:MAG: tyrosine-type recombinase/integrase [Cytophaga sp.]
MQFLEYKRTLGYKYIFAERILMSIDKFAIERKEKSPGLSREFTKKWGKRKISECSRTQSIRVSVLIAFSQYLNDIGIESHIPKQPKVKSTFVPYVFTKCEIEDIFNALDNELPQQVSHSSSSACVPAFIRLLYATGIRINEAVELKNEDINFEMKHIHIKDSKSGKARIIPISDSLVSVLSEYKSFRNQSPFKSKSGNFFLKLNGHTCSAQSIRDNFKKIIRKVGIPYVQNNGPRIHDLRHTFAVSAFAQMAEQGIDLYASHPIISNYLGHQSLSATNHYIRLTRDKFPQLLKDLSSISIDVFPKFSDYEEAN